jgi:DNA polymerase-3 subunit beta
MKIALKTEELKKNLSLIKGVSASKALIALPVSSHFLLEAHEKTGSTFATDGEVAIKLPLAVEDTEGDALLCLNANILYDIVKELDAETITIEAEDAEHVVVRAGKSKFRMNCTDPAIYPQWKDPFYEGNVYTVVLPAKRLLEMIEKTLFAAGESDTRFTLNSLLFHMTPDWFRLVGTDGARLSLITDYEAETPVLKAPLKVIVPKRAFSELRKLLKGEPGNVQIMITENLVWFLLESGVSFLTRTIEGNYPPYEDVIPKYDNMASISKEEFRKALRLASIVASENGSVVKLESQNKSLTVKAESPIGNFNDDIQEIYGEMPESIGFNYRYLLEAIERMEGETIYYRFDPEEKLSPVVLTGDDTDFLYVVMPVRS